METSQTVPFLFFCSEIAACIGENKYKKQWEAFETLFMRFDDGHFYKEAMKRMKNNGCQILSTTEKVEKIACDVTMQPVIQDFMQSKTQTARDLQHAIETFEVNTSMKEVHFKEQQDHLKRKLNTQLLMEEDLKRQYTQPNDNLKQKIDQVQIERQETTKKISCHEKEWMDFKCAKTELIRQKQTKFGHDKEESLIQSNLLGNVIGNNSELYKVFLGSHPIRWGICGRIDGFRDGKLIEIKNRKSHIFNPLPKYDIIQVQCYLHIIGLQEATLIQSLALGNGEYELHETVIYRDDVYWQKCIFPELYAMISLLHRFCSDKLLQDQYFQTADNKKTMLFKKMQKPHKKSKLEE